MKTGSSVCVWNHLTRRMTNQIDCETILRRSTGKGSFREPFFHPFHLDEGQHLTVESILPTRTLVFVGLNTGHLIIVKPSTMQVLYTIHAFDQHVFHLFPLSPLTFTSTTHPSSTTNGRFVTQFKYLQERFEQHRLSRDSSTRTPVLAVPDIAQEDDPDNTSYLLAIGYGAYSCRSIPQLQHYRSESIFLQAWSLDDFLL